SREGKQAARPADRRAGRGGWKKRRPLGNRVDRGCAHGRHHPTRKRADVCLVLHHQRVWPTSQGEKADDGSGDTDWCTLPPDDGAGAPSAYGEDGVTGGIRRGSTAFRKGRWQGLSGMQGNLHVPFLGGWVGAIPPGYPAGESNLASLSRRLCSASNLAEARRVPSLWQDPSPAKTRASSIPARAHGHHHQPSTNCYKLSDLCCTPQTPWLGPQ